MPPPFEGTYTRQFLADLTDLGPAVQWRIMNAIETKLLTDPFQHARKLVNEKGPGLWRFRVGDYRIRFDMEDRRLIFYRVRHRREIYR